MEQPRGGCVSRATLLAYEPDYDGTRVLRGFRSAFLLAGLCWFTIALTAYAVIGLTDHSGPVAIAAANAATMR